MRYKAKDPDLALLVQKLMNYEAVIIMEEQGYMPNRVSSKFTDSIKQSDLVRVKEQILTLYARKGKKFDPEKIKRLGLSYLNMQIRITNNPPEPNPINRACKTLLKKVLEGEYDWSFSEISIN